MTKPVSQVGGSIPLTQLPPVPPANQAAPAAAPRNTPAPSGTEQDGTAQRGRGPKSDGGWSARLHKMRHTKAVPHEPALRFEGEWKSSAARQVCTEWINIQTRHQAHTISLVALSRMKALDYERKHRAEIPEAQRLLPGNPTKQAYYGEQVKAFLDAIGISGEVQKALLDSFKLAGTGGLHRQHVTAVVTVTGIVGGAAQLLSTQNPAAAAGLYGVRLLLQILTAERIMDSGWRRLRNAGTEDVLPHGRADATVSAKSAPTVFEAAHAVIWELRGVEKNLHRLETAMQALASASAAYEASGSDHHRQLAQAAQQKLDITYARMCFQTETKISYKTASDSAKTEFRGNQRYLATSYAATSLTLGAGLLSILAPTMGMAAAPVTGGASIGVAGLVMLLYAAYQLSSAPSKDGEEKAKRAIVGISKSIDVLSGDKVASREERGAAYATYIEERKASRFQVGKERTASRAAAKSKLLEQLGAIAREDAVNDGLDIRGNWKVYTAYREAVAHIEANAQQHRLPQPEQDAAIKLLDDDFQALHGPDFSTQAISDAWKNPMRIRMDTARRLVKGKVAQSHQRLIALQQLPGPQVRVFKTSNKSAVDACKNELRRDLLSMFNLELALHYMAPAMEEASDLSGTTAHAAAAMGAIADEDVRNIFCGDGEQQVEMANKAKKLTAGEAERYVYTNIGASALGIGLNVGVGTTDLGLNAAKASGTVHVGLHDPNPEEKPRIPRYPDYKLAAVSQAGAPLAAHINAGNRAAFQQTQMPDALKITTRPEEEHVELTLHIPSGLSHLEDAGTTHDEANAVVEQLAHAHAVPDKIILSRAYADPEASPSQELLVINLQGTAAYHRSQHKHAGAREKLSVAGAKTRIVARHILISLVGLPAQGIAQYNLGKTRAPLRRAAELDHQVRHRLAAAILPSPELRGEPAASGQSGASGSAEPAVADSEPGGIEPIAAEPPASAPRP